MDEKTQAILVLEILGRPAEHIKKTISEIVTNLGKEKGVKIIRKKIAEAQPLEDRDLFTSFAEIEIETSLQQLMLLIFAYMPSHVDIVTPEEIKVKNSELNLFLNELARKLHQYDELAKTLMIERQILAKQIKEGKIKIENKPLEKVSKDKEKKTTKKKKRN